MEKRRGSGDQPYLGQTEVIRECEPGPRTGPITATATRTGCREPPFIGCNSLFAPMTKTTGRSRYLKIEEVQEIQARLGQKIRKLRNENASSQEVT